MNTSLYNINKAKEIIKGDKELMKSLKDWYSLKGRLPTNERHLNWTQWLGVRLNDIAGQIGIDKTPNEIIPRDMVDALSINAMGVPLADSLSNLACAQGFKTDIDCYVEGGIVFASIWLGGENAETTDRTAEWLKDEFIKKGWAASVWIDEEDDREATVNAQIDFSIYKK